MSDRAPSRTSSQPTSLLASLTKQILRAWRAVLWFASRWFQIESLYRFNAKFQPTWVPHFVIYPATRDLPRIVVAALEAEAFLTWPGLHRLSGARA